MPPHQILCTLEVILINPLVAVRDIHFAASVIVAGIVFFDLFIAVPVLRADLRFPATEALFADRTTKIVWVNLALSLASAFFWLCLLSARIAGKPFDAVIADGTIWIVLSRTQFGFVWAMRLGFGIMLAACLLPRRKGAAIWPGVWAALLAGGYLGLLAFAGHGEEGLGLERNVHLAADFLHLIAAGLWLGGLVPLALLLTYLRRFREEAWVKAASDAASRFSTLGILAVGILLISGTINASFLIGGIQSLTDTFYGRLLLLKIALFAAMVLLAGINRQYFLPRLCGDAGIDQCLMIQRLVRSTLAEMSLGLGIILIVGILGIMAPANDMAGHLH
jgi:putative copper resistance protein D